MEISNLLFTDGILKISDDMVCIRISSDGESASDRIRKMLFEAFNDSLVLIKEIAFEDDINELAQFCDPCTIRLFSGKYKLGFFTVHYPELHAIIRGDSNINNVLQRWTSINYITQVLYVFSSENTNYLFSKLENDVYKECDSISNVWTNVKIAIRNQPESDNNTFMVFTHSRFFSKVRKYLEC